MAEKVREFDVELSYRLDLAVVKDEENNGQGIWHEFKRFLERLIFVGKEDEYTNEDFL